MNFIEIMFLLLVGHAVSDFALQPSIMAKLKSRHNKPDWIPDGQKYVPTWFFWLSAHGLIHGGMVFLITDIVWLGIAEVISHMFFDFLKCENVTTPYWDQYYHFMTKVIWALMWVIIT